MPVKVRCPGCEKVLNAPDKARGKAIRCPQCESPVKVPAGSGSTARAGAKKKSAPNEDFLTGLDLTREDDSAKICPKCGADVPEDSTECPKCFVNVETGLISAKARKKLTRGIDTDQYYRGLPSDAWQWVASNPKLILRTITYLLISSAVFLGAAFMQIYVSKAPLKFFWGFIALIAALVGPGWLWYLDTATIRATMSNKRMSLKKDDGRFDIFQCVSLGIKFFVWHLFTLFPLIFGIAGLVMLNNDNALVGGILIGAGYVLMLPVLAVGMIHMTMPVQMPAWNPLILFKDFGKTIAPSLYWTVFALLTMAPAAGLIATIGVVYGQDLREFVSIVSHNSEVAWAKSAVQDPPSKNASEEEQKEYQRAQQLSQQELREVPWNTLTVPLILWGVAILPLGAGAVFNMRSNGLLGYYFRGDMSLQTLEKEVKFVKKERELDDEGRVIHKTDRKEQAVKSFLGIGGTILFYVVGNVILYYASGGKYVLMPRGMARALNLYNQSQQSAPAEPTPPPTTMQPLNPSAPQPGAPMPGMPAGTHGQPGAPAGAPGAPPGMHGPPAGVPGVPPGMHGMP